MNKKCECGCGELVKRRFVFGHHKRRDLVFRFMGKVVKTDSCWLWSGPKSMGYGVIFIRDTRNNVGAHRISYSLFKGPIPIGMFVCHSCDNKLCVNPDHLFIGTAKDNTQDMISKGRKGKPLPEKTRCPGTKNGNSKMNWEKVQEMRSRYLAGGVSQKALAMDYGLSQASVWAILSKVTWKDKDA